MRSLGRPFIAREDGTVENTMRLKLTNRTEGARTYTFHVEGVAGATLTNQARVMWNSSDTITSTPGAPPSAGAFDGASPIDTAVPIVIEVSRVVRNVFGERIDS